MVGGIGDLRFWKDPLCDPLPLRVAFSSQPHCGNVQCSSAFEWFEVTFADGFRML